MESLFDGKHTQHFHLLSLFIYALIYSYFYAFY